MKSTKILHAEIIGTLEAIERVNESIARHQQEALSDHFSINQWQEVKSDLLLQLHDLLAKLDALPVATAA